MHEHHCVTPLQLLRQYFVDRKFRILHSHSRIGELLGEPAQTDIKNAYANQKFYLQLLDDLEVANSIEAINSIMEKQFEPNTSFLTDAQIDSVSALFERKTAELTA